MSSGSYDVQPRCHAADCTDAQHLRPPTLTLGSTKHTLTPTVATHTNSTIRVVFARRLQSLMFRSTSDLLLNLAVGDVVKYDGG